MKKTTSKEPKSLSEMAVMLKERGLTNRESVDLEQYLYVINCHRLLSYARYYQVDPLNGNNNFIDGTDIADLIALIKLDGALQSLILEGIRVLELKLRGVIAYEFSQTTGAYGYLKYDNYLSKDIRDPQTRAEMTRGLISSINRNIADSREMRISNAVENGIKIPIWTAVEVVSFSTLAKMFSLYGDLNCKERITQTFRVNKKRWQFTQTLRAIVVLRNLSAHYSRLWSRHMQISSALPNWIHKKYPNAGKESVMQALVLLMETVDKIIGNKHYSERVMSIINQNAQFKDGICNPKSESIRWGK
jgi:abortive infection bacteriophage resistance protein